jgi:Leucine-rich repeat (LRR) protein
VGRSPVITSVNPRQWQHSNELYFVADVLGNLTAVKVLDLSYNELTQLPTAVFGPPHNLTVLYLQHNQLTMLPLAYLLSLKPQLRIVDVRANRLRHFHHELMPLVENGTQVLYSGKYRQGQFSPDPRGSLVLMFISKNKG